MASEEPGGKRNAWLELLRPPNLFTVPGDVLAGMWMSIPLGASQPGGLALVLTPLAVCLIYLSGLVMNDLADEAEDRRERPDRPIPSSRVSKKAAWLVMIGLIVLALTILVVIRRRALIFGLFLVGCVVLYNAWAKHRAAFGPCVMGMCRGFSLLTGAAAVMPKGHAELFPGLLTGFEILLLYVAAITLLARNETRASNPSLQAWFPTVALLGGWAVLPFFAEPETALFSALYGAFAVLSLVVPFHTARRISQRRRVIPGDIGLLIGNLIVVQATLFAWFAPHIGWALGWLLLFPVSRVVAQKFYAS